MATCETCGLDMSKAKGCTAAMFDDFADGVVRKRLRYGSETRGDYVGADRRCHSCHVRVGEFHHPGCDVEECPKCFTQAISCSCCDKKKKGSVHA